MQIVRKGVEQAEEEYVIWLWKKWGVPGCGGGLGSVEASKCVIHMRYINNAVGE